MATILDFPPRTSAERLRGSRATGSAEIVLFPGVRYERWEEAPAAKRPRRKSVKRDTLEIAD